MPTEGVKLTKQRIAAVAVLVLAAGAFALDRGVLGADETAVNEQIAPGGAQPTGEPGPDAAMNPGAPNPMPRVQLISVGSRMAALTSPTATTDLGDALAVPPEWVKAAPKAAEVESVEARPIEVREFSAQLKGVISTSKGPLFLCSSVNP